MTKLKELMEETRTTIYKVHDATGIVPSTVYRMSSGQMSAKKHADVLAHYFSVSPDSFFEGKTVYLVKTPDGDVVHLIEEQYKSAKLDGAVEVYYDREEKRFIRKLRVLSRMNSETYVNKYSTDFNDDNLFLGIVDKLSRLSHEDLAKVKNVIDAMFPDK